MTILFANNASTTVAGSISSIDTTVTLQSGTIFPHPLNVGDYFVATFYDQQTKTLNEIVHVTNLTGNVATIVRGQEGTTPLAWNSGDIFANLVTAGTLEAFLQQGAVPVNTTDVYVGDDVSTTPNHIICNTVPVPPAYALGMLFIIRVKNSNTGPTDCSFNGVPAVLAKRTDGSDLIGGNIIGAQEYVFIYNGTFFQTTIQHVPQQPPQTTFYIRADSLSVVDSNGLESNSGFFNTPQDAFKTIQGAVNTLKSRYISQITITLRVADGTYMSGVYDASQYISAWNIIGNAANPQNCIINCTSTNVASYVPGAIPGVCVTAGDFSTFTVQGFTFYSYNGNVQITHAGNLTLKGGINFNAPQGTPFPCVYSFGACRLTGNFTYSTSSNAGAIFAASYNGYISFGWSDLTGTYPLSIHLNGLYNLDYICICDTGGAMGIFDNLMTLSGPQANAAQYRVSNTGGIHFATGNNTAFGVIANQPGIIDQPSPTSPGGYIT